MTSDFLPGPLPSGRQDLPHNHKLFFTSQM
jgi:hypothetical protein